MGHDRDRDTDQPARIPGTLTRRALLQDAVAAGSFVGMAGASPVIAFVRQTGRDDTPRTNASPASALALARALNRTRFGDLPPLAVEHAKMIIASTFASAAPGSLFSSARIIRDLAKEHGGRPEATVWFDGAKLPVHEAAHVNATLSDAAASDDSDIRTTAHTGTNVAAVGLAIAERMGATGQEVLCAIVTGYEAAGRIGEAKRGGRGGIHASQIVAFGGTVAAAKLLKLTDAQMAHAICMTAVTMGGLSIGTNSLAREYMGGNAAYCAVNAALAAGRGYTVNEDMLEAPGGFVAVFGGGTMDAETLTRDYGKEWDIARFMAVKLVPGAHALHSTAEAAVNAARQSGVGPEEVTRILISGQNGRNIRAGSRPPKDLVEAIHSLPYFVASAVADKDFSWVHASPAKVSNPAMARLIGLVESDPSPGPVKYDWSYGGTVTIITKSGRRFTSTVDAPRGSSPRGIEWSDVDAKYRALMPESRTPAKRIEETLNLIHHFDQVKNVAQLTGLLKAS